MQANDKRKPATKCDQVTSVRGSRSICESDNHKGHGGPRKKTLKPESFVILRVLGGSRVLLLDGENEPLPRS